MLAARDVTDEVSAPAFPCPDELLGPATLADDPCLAACGWGAGAEPAHQYYRARYYDPKIGRFISEDPIKLAGGLNLYRYVRNNPTNLIDPSGLQSADLRDFYDPLPKQQWRFTGVPDNCVDAISFMAVTAWRVHAGKLPDKIGHCQAHCELVKQCGSIGKVSSFFVSYGKECYDDVKCHWNPRSGWDDSDIDANDWGASCPANQSCEERCKNAQTLFP
jgi:uncharacterized protein RhaS with RHS repeats